MSFTPSYSVLIGDCTETLQQLGDQSVHCCVTSPPYFGLRDYGHEGQIGLEDTPDEYVARLVEVFREVRRVLRDDGTLWLNLGDSYARSPAKGQHKSGQSGDKNAYVYDRGNGRASATFLGDGLKEKDIIGVPWRVAFALQADGWYLRQDIIWHKPNPMPESVRDRCTKSHEYLFLLSKSPRYSYDANAIKEPAIYGAKGSEFHTGKTGEHQLGRAQKVRPSISKGGFAGKTEALASTGQNAFRAITDMRNRRSVWTVSSKPYAGAHFATFPPGLVEPCILAGCPKGGTVLDPFGGSGTTAGVAMSLHRNSILCEINPEYADLVHERVLELSGVQHDMFGKFVEVAG
ncbi:DNA-methyltransferase [Marinobacter sp. JSM 1782161]|uniref:DNA-methyltransferase n=1 Tax=Marinobacter sp. JSM 1782161 TaxID=2685906 RepID=UPI001403A532|nr:site-specific DNA-methyltransferase [Marinobacter sp. JSM 1782161]